MKPMRPITRRALFALASVLLVLAAAEGTARLIWTDTELHFNPELHFFKDDPTLFWVQKANLNTIFRGGYRLTTNSLGLRNPEIVMPRPKNVYRILSLGESTTWGDRVELDQTYSKVLERLLNEARSGGADGSKTFDVINAGVGGYTIWQSYEYLKEKGLGLDPQMVMIYHLTNDFLPSQIIDSHNFLYKVEYTDRELYQRRRWIAPVLRLLFPSRAYLALRKGVLLLPSRLPRSAPQFPPKYVRVPYKDRLEALEKMNALCRERHIEFVIIQPFYKMSVFPDTLLRDFAASRGTHYVDLPNLLWQSLGSSPAPLFYKDDVHPTPEGHRLIAEAIFKSIRPIIGNPKQ